MNKLKLKKLLALFLALVMCFSLLPVSAFAEGKAAEEPTAPAGDDVPGGPQTDPVGEAISLPPVALPRSIPAAHVIGSPSSVGQGTVLCPA